MNMQKVGNKRIEGKRRQNVKAIGLYEYVFKVFLNDRVIEVYLQV